VSGNATVRPPVDGGVPAGPPGSVEVDVVRRRVITCRISFAVSGEPRVCAVDGVGVPPTR